MRAKQSLRLPSELKLVYDRITFSRLTIAYFIFSLANFVTQLSFQVQAFSVNAEAASFLFGVLSQGKQSSNSFPVLRADLRMCDVVPTSLDVSACRVVWDGTPLTNNSIGGPQSFSLADQVDPYALANISNSVAVVSASALSSTISIATATSLSVNPGSSLSPSSAAPSSATAAAPKSLDSVKVQGSETVTVFVRPTAVTLTVKQTITSTSTSTSTISATPKAVDNHEIGTDDSFHHIRRQAPEIDGQYHVDLNGMGFNHVSATLDATCLVALNWPVSILDNTKREDIVFMAFQFWVLGMSTVALLNESIPHILASLLTHILVTGWGGFQIYHTSNFHKEFNRLITDGACDPVVLLPHYWQARGSAEIPSLALNVIALFISAFLTWRLVKLFGWQTFKRVGASRTINRLYKIVLILSITIQLSLFFMVVTLGLWIDQLYNGDVAKLAILSKVYRAVFIVTLILLIPWLTTGWVAVRRELKIPMMFFLVLSLLYIIGSCTMFASTTFRWTFLTWGFFTIMALASMFLTFTSFILGLICRWNFGRNLSRYLNAQESLADDDIEPINPNDVEKVAYPSNEKPVPTYSAAFGSSPEEPLPSQMRAGPHLGPRFFKASAEPFEPQLAAPERAYTNMRPGGPRDGSASLVRNNSNQSRVDNVSRSNSQSSITSNKSGNGRRFVIE